jgi:hypothetical protein
MDIVCPEVVVQRYYDHINKVERIRRERVWIEPKPITVICDHDAEDRRTFERSTNIGTVPAIKMVSAGIDLHKERLKPDERGMPKFYLMEDSLVEKDQRLVHDMQPTCTLEEYPAYIWKVNNSTGRKLDEPVKDKDHGMDTDRYMTMYMDWRGKPRASMMNA